MWLDVDDFLMTYDGKESHADTIYCTENWEENCNIHTQSTYNSCSCHIPTTPTTPRPSVMPTNDPIFPTVSPTNKPTAQPSVHPTPQPTEQPTGQPTGQPTEPPIPYPTGHPTAISTTPGHGHGSSSTTASTMTTMTEHHYPTLVPTEIPSDVEVGYMHDAVIFYGEAEFSHDFLTIYVYLTATIMGGDANTDVDVYDNSESDVDIGDTECSRWFDDTTSDLLSDYTDCTFDFHMQRIVIDLSSMATLKINDILIIKANVFYAHTTSSHRQEGEIVVKTNKDEIFIEAISVDEVNSISPGVLLYKFPQQFGLCDDLVLDARNSYNLGVFGFVGSLCGCLHCSSVGKQRHSPKLLFFFFVAVFWLQGGRAANFGWSVNNGHYNGKRVEIPSDLLPTGAINIFLNVTVWYSDNVFEFFYNTTKSDEAIPSMNIDGISSFNNDNYEYDLIVFNFDILFKYDCHNNTSIVNYTELNYDIEVNVFENDLIMDVSSSTFSIDLSDLSLTIDKTQLSVGSVYDFEFHMICDDDDYNICDISGYHSLYYSFSNLVCQISNGNKYLSNVNYKFLKSYYYILDGNTFSYDPDDGDGKFIKYEWNCTKYTYYNNDDDTFGDGYDCTNDGILSDKNMSITIVSLFNENLNESFSNMTYIYVFEMIMYDSKNNDVRESCVSTSTLTIENVIFDDYDNDHNNTSFLDVGVSAISTTINSNEKLRLIATINNVDMNRYDEFSFEWDELHGYLSPHDIIQHQVENTRDNHNVSNNYLILNPNILTPGMTYEFQVTVTQHESSNIFASASVEIVVNNAASVVDESFAILPNDICNGNAKNLSSFSDAFETFYDISIEANGNEDGSRLYYQFGFIYDNEHWLFDSYLFQNAFLSGKFCTISMIALI